jgi:DNA-binding NarL/FixJ family response regulator
MARDRCRILIVDDHDSWRLLISSWLQEQPEYQVVGKASDGLEAVLRTQELQPDVILLDIGLPRLNGIEAARRIRAISPTSYILFVTENRSQEIAEEALRTGARGYVIKSDAWSDLLPALRAVLEGKRFISASLAGLHLADGQSGSLQRKKTVEPFPAQEKTRHEVGFYADGSAMLDHFARFCEAALKAGGAVIVVLTESHQANLLQRLAADGVNVAAEIERGTYIPLEVASIISSCMVNGALDSVLCNKFAGDLIKKAARSGGEGRRIAVCGEPLNTLLEAGNAEAVLMLEHLWSEIAHAYQLQVLCGYLRTAFASAENISVLEMVCAEHSAAHGRELSF